MSSNQECNSQKYLLSPKDELDYLLNSIEEISKHCRNLLFILVVSSLYILLTSYTEDIQENIVLPILDVSVSSAYFSLASPIILVSIYIYLHIYINELQERLRFFKNSQFEYRYSYSSEVVLFPWIFVFSQQKRSRWPIRYLTGSLIWAFCPVVLFVLWWRFLIQEDVASFVSCTALILAAFASAKFEDVNKKFITLPATIGALSLFVVTTSSLPAARARIGFLNDIWANISVSFKQANVEPSVVPLSMIFILVPIIYILIPTFMGSWLDKIMRILMRLITGVRLARTDEESMKIGPTVILAHIFIYLIFVAILAMVTWMAGVV